MMKPVILMGKGPSARPIEVSDKYVVGALNSAILFCDRIDYFFLQDIETLDNVSPDDIERIDTAVVPAHPYKNHLQHPSLTFANLIAGLPGIRNFSVYQNPLEVSGIEQIPGLPYFPFIRSGGDAAVQWLLEAGHREFIFVGIDPDGGYHRKVEENSAPLDQTKRIQICCPNCDHDFAADITLGHSSGSPNPPQWYKMQYQSMISKIMKAGGTFRHLGPQEELEPRLSPQPVLSAM